MVRKKIIDMVEKDIIFMIRQELSYYQTDIEKRNKSTEKILKLINTKKRTWDLEVVDIDNNTMLSYASYNQSLVLVKALIEKGAIIERKNKMHFDHVLYVPQPIEACMYNKNEDVLYFLFPLIQKRESLIGAIATSYGILFDHVKIKREFLYTNTDICPEEVLECLIQKNWPDAVDRMVQDDKYKLDLDKACKIYNKYKKSHHLDLGDWKKHLSHFLIKLERNKIDNLINENEEKIISKKLKL